MAQCARFPGPPEERPDEPLWRSVLGARLRELRHRAGLSLTETARRAAVSPQYLSELERGRKEASSEILAAVAVALDSSVLEVAALTVADLRRVRMLRTGRAARIELARPSRPTGPVALAGGLALAA